MWAICFQFQILVPCSRLSFQLYNNRDPNSQLESPYTNRRSSWNKWPCIARSKSAVWEGDKEERTGRKTC